MTSGLAPHTGVRLQHRPMSTSNAPSQLRLIIEATDFDGAVTFFRDVLGMPEQPAFATSGDDRVSILHAGSATVEIASVQHVRTIDEIEGAPPATGPALRLALEVDDTDRAVESVTAAGGEGTNRWLQVVAVGLRTHDLRLAFEALGLEANRVLRTRYGPIAMDRSLARGRSRPLTEGELKSLREIAQVTAGGSRKPIR